LLPIGSFEFTGVFLALQAGSSNAMLVYLQCVKRIGLVHGLALWELAKTASSTAEGVLFVENGQSALPFLESQPTFTSIP
jgi:hypothetical protein